MVDRIAVRLQGGTLSMAEAATNKFGELQLEFDVVKDFSLVIGPEEQNVMILPLSGVRAGSLKKRSF
jgi:hypothetical protein